MLIGQRHEQRIIVGKNSKLFIPQKLKLKSYAYLRIQELIKKRVSKQSGLQHAPNFAKHNCWK